MVTELTGTDRSCHCPDKSLDQLRDLIAAGVPQAEASRILWDPEAPPTGPGTAVRAWVRARLKAAFPDLRLPNPTNKTTEGTT